jgi:hypothetical protein
MKTLNRILLSENTKAIEQATSSADERAEKLNDIAPIFEFESEEEFNSRTENIDRLVKAAMLARPALKKLAQTVQVDALKIPEDLASARDKIISLIRKHDDLFANISHDGKQWIADIDKLEAFAESQRIFAEGEKQIQKLEGAKNLCEFLNKHKFGFATYEKGNYHNVMIDWSLKESKWEPSIHWIKS